LTDVAHPAYKEGEPFEGPRDILKGPRGSSTAYGIAHRCGTSIVQGHSTPVRSSPVQPCHPKGSKRRVRVSSLALCPLTHVAHRAQSCDTISAPGTHSKAIPGPHRRSEAAAVRGRPPAGPQLCARWATSVHKARSVKGGRASLERCPSFLVITVHWAAPRSGNRLMVFNR